MNRWLIAALVALVLSSSYLLDGPTETDALQADSLNLSDAIADARSAKEYPNDHP